eukprot:1050643-Prorocentrum_minimum.AAC.1
MLIVFARSSGFGDPEPASGDLESLDRAKRVAVRSWVELPLLLLSYKLQKLRPALTRLAAGPRTAVTRYRQRNILHLNQSHGQYYFILRVLLFQ